MPTTTTVPTYTGNSAGNVIASGSLGAGANTNANFDGHGKMGVKFTVKNTPGGSVSGVRGLKIEIFDRYGSTPTTAPSSSFTLTLPSATASTAESSPAIWLTPGSYYNIKLTNLDASQGITVEVTADTIDNFTTS